MYGIHIEPSVLQAKVTELSSAVAAYRATLIACEQTVAGINAVNIGAHAIGFTQAHAQFISASTGLAVLLDQAQLTLNNTGHIYSISEHNNAVAMQATWS